MLASLLSMMIQAGGRGPCSRLGCSECLRLAPGQFLRLRAAIVLSAPDPQHFGDVWLLLKFEIQKCTVVRELFNHCSLGNLEAGAQTQTQSSFEEVERGF
jgi:hypothetical protein